MIREVGLFILKGQNIATKLLLLEAVFVVARRKSRKILNTEKEVFKEIFQYLLPPHNFHFSFIFGRKFYPCFSA